MTRSNHPQVAGAQLWFAAWTLIAGCGVAAADDGETGAAATDGGPRYPRAVIARPLTLPQGIAMLGADVTSSRDLRAMGGAPIVGAGLTDALEVQIPYAFAAREFEARGSLNVDVGEKLLRGAAGGKLEAIARVRAGYNLLTETANPLMIGVHVQYNVTDKLAIISGVPGTQQLSVALSSGGVAGGPKPIDLSLPISLGYQITPVLYLQLDTRLARFGIEDSTNAFLFADTTPAALTAVYNIAGALDLQASIATDLTSSPGDALSFLIGARFYAGAL